MSQIKKLNLQIKTDNPTPNQSPLTSTKTQTQSQLDQLSHKDQMAKVNNLLNEVKRTLKKDPLNLQKYPKK